ncbi:MAG: hypothetical protein ACHQRM_09930 [Bacteroidia bacterium]
MEATFSGEISVQKRESPNILERYNNKPKKEIQEGMSAAEMAEIISDRLMEFTRKQVETKK